MLWLKYWLETRLRLLFAVFLFVGLTTSGYVAIKKAPRRPPNPIPAEERLAGTLNIYGLFWIMPAVMLAAAGVKTQSPFQAVKGLHGSMHFTLSRPVSRRRLFSTRVAIGLLEVAVVVIVGCYGQWILLPLTFPELSFFPGDILRHAFTVIAGMTFFFFLSVLLATFLDDVWQMFGSLILLGLLAWLSIVAAIPAYFSIFRSIGGASPLVTHQIPWGAIALSLGLAAILCLAALKVLLRRDF